MDQSLTSLLQEFQSTSNFKPYISSIVFPNFKNIESSSELKFDFPLTLLIGKNGTNKSSILHALYGCPQGKSTGEYWFSTHIDPIDNDDKKRAAYFYRYTVVETGETAEVLKARIKNANDPDYWEPSRPVQEYGMAAMPKNKSSQPGRSQTRWNAIKKDVIYLNFRADISAFDKAFYKTVNNRIIHRKILRKNSKALKDSIDNNLQSKYHYKKERISVNHIFTDEQREHVNKILDTQYTKIVYIEHDFYLSESFSVYVQKENNEKYSEAFAGSGETNVIRLVYAIDKAPMNSLILLDEPETSLHIEAQYRIKEFILSKIKKMKHQVIISTHSPFFASGLPDYAIKVLYPDIHSNKIKIINSSPADESSFYLGYRRTDASKASVILEDKLGRALVMHVMHKMLTESQRDKIDLVFLPGGATTMLNIAASEMLKPSSNVGFLFDGDQAPSDGIPDPDNIPPSDNYRLEQIIKDTFGHLPNIPRDSNNPIQKIESLRKYLKFAKTRFKYLPFQTPEEFIVKNSEKFSKLNTKTVTDYKNFLSEKAIEILASTGDVDSNSIFYFQRQLIFGINDNEDFNSISQILIEFSEHSSHLVQSA